MICKMCESVDNKIEDEGAKALSQCLTHLTQLTQFSLRGQCALLGYSVCDV